MYMDTAIVKFIMNVTLHFIRDVRLYPTLNSYLEDEIIYVFIVDCLVLAYVLLTSCFVHLSTFSGVSHQ